MLQTLDRLAAKSNTTTSELVRRYVEQGLAVDGNKENVDFIAGIIRQELTAVYQLDDIKRLTDLLCKYALMTKVCRPLTLFIELRSLLSAVV